jgi:DNA mismatch repair protein MutS
LNLSDLNIDKELIPFFDNSLNRHSRDALASLFHTLPATTEESQARQEVIAAFTINCNRIKNLHSYRADIEDCYEFCRRLEYIAPESIMKPGKLRRTLMLSRKKTERLRSESVQILLLFENIFKHYIGNIDISLFPVHYKDSLRSITDTLSYFHKERRALIEKGNNLNIREIAEFMHRLHALYINGMLKKFWTDFFLFEAYLSISITSNKAGLTAARFIENGIHITGLFHPLIEHPVKNTLHIEKSTFVLTGPNMSGKSTLLRSVSLCIYLARLGLPVPAAECNVFFADEINVYINAHDNPQNGYSHFMTEVVNLKDSIINAKEGKKVFAVFDELFSGTNVDDALNILSITIKGLKQFINSYFLLSTHFYKLREVQTDEMNHVAFFCIDALLEDGIPKFTYRVKEGWSEIKFGSILFEREGLIQLLK